MTRRFWLLTGSAAFLALLASGGSPTPQRFVWNRTDSAPLGLYWISDRTLTLNDWAVVSANSKDAQWAEDHGFVGRDWLLIKRVRAMPGDEICRHADTIFINEKAVTSTKKSDRFGRGLPIWNGCLTLADDEVFLLNKHPDSLDGRYFGATRQVDIDGSAKLIWRQR